MADIGDQISWNCIFGNLRLAESERLNQKVPMSCRESTVRCGVVLYDFSRDNLLIGICFLVLYDFSRDNLLIGICFLDAPRLAANLGRRG